ncbi:hypothetical protein BpHYR1_053605 [Brachionus plicatilis]|uniref:DUF2599 domain-containing protein n=1 Tax=Brachionus plicatilis TaxID=10195 RepID=A0A3M7PH33_BRAPC|nr:hypothetical protein BpHYR1_053605 [Brachionus plicatilis]
MRLLLALSLLLFVRCNDNFDSYFESASWIDRNGVVALSIFHKTIAYDKVEAAFKELETRFSSDVQWKNRDALYMQFLCHVNFAPAKNPWNIEPHRVTTSYLQHILNACNPPRKYYYYV